MCETAFGTGQLLVKLRTRFVIVSIYNTSLAHALQGAPRRMFRIRTHSARESQPGVRHRSDRSAIPNNTTQHTKERAREVTRTPKGDTINDKNRKLP